MPRLSPEIAAERQAAAARVERSRRAVAAAERESLRAAAEALAVGVSMRSVAHMMACDHRTLRADLDRMQAGELIG